MLPMMSRMTQLAVGSVLAGAAALSSAQDVRAAQTLPAPVETHWATSWIAPPEPTWGPDFTLPVGMPEQLENVTLRQNLRVSVGGDRIRLVVDNAYSDRPLKIGRAHVAIDGGHAGAFATFGGESEVVVAAGAKAVSDPIALTTPPASRLQVDLYLPERSRLAGFHWDAHDRSLLLPGNAAGHAEATTGQELATRAFLSAVLVASAR
jgi:hypothetical protein